MFRQANRKDINFFINEKVRIFDEGKRTLDNLSLNALIPFANTPEGMETILKNNRVNESFDIDTLSMSEAIKWIEFILDLGPVPLICDTSTIDTKNE